MSPHRRTFLRTAAAAPAFLSALPPVSAADARLDPKLVRVGPDVQPLVRLLEETPRDSVLGEVGSRIKKGLSYQELLAALFLAGVRNVQPRPSVGFKFHAVLVINSAHLASLASPDSERWLPLLWAVDRFKAGQADTKKESGWRMGPVDEANVPQARHAARRFREAMDAWDEGAADAAAAAVARSLGMNEAFELFARVGCRDFRDIGHKAIYVANAFRTLQAIGWRHAEPVLRSLAYALLQHEGDNPAKRDAPADRPGRRNLELARKLGPGWRDGTSKPAATADVLAAVREASADGIADSVVSLVAGGVSPRSVWDGLFLAAGELLMRQPGIVALHSLTTLNALRYAHDTTADDDTRRLTLLQAAAFLPLFRDAMTGRGKVGGTRIDAVEPAEKPADAAAVFAELSRDKLSAARLALGYLNGDAGRAAELTAAGRRLIFLKGTDAHDYKFSSAVIEDAANLSPEHRDRFLAASLFWLKGSAAADAPIVARIRDALA